MSNSTSSDITKKMLTASLKKYMAIKPLNKISIREIVEDCGLNRQTFYYHFADIFDLVKWMYQQEALTQLAQHEGISLWQEGLLQLFSYLQENKTVCLCTLNSMGRDHLKQFFYTDLRDIIEKAVLSFPPGQSLSEEFTEFLTHFYTISLAAVIESWLLGEFKQSPPELIDLIDNLLRHQIRGFNLSC